MEVKDKTIKLVIIELPCYYRRIVHAIAFG